MNEPRLEDRISLLEKEVLELRQIVAETLRKQSWPQYITKQDLAEILHVSTRTIEDWVSENRIPHHKAGSSLRFLISEIVEWTASRGGDKQRHKP